MNNDKTFPMGYRVGYLTEGARSDPDSYPSDKERGFPPTKLKLKLGANNTKFLKPQYRTHISACNFNRFSKLWCIDDSHRALRGILQVPLRDSCFLQIRYI